MRFLLKLSAPLFALLGSLASSTSAAQAAPGGGRVVLVLPFENRSGNTSLSWVGDSFPDTLDKRLNSAGFLTISHDDRDYAFDHLGLPVQFRPSRATTIRIAQQLDANYVVIGSFTTNGDKISIQARVLSVDGFRLSAPLEDGAQLTRLFDAENAIAWKVAREMNSQFNIAEGTFLAAAGAVPLSAFEDYIRGTNASSPDERITKLKAAVAISPDYAAALLALGKIQFAAHDYTAAAATLSRVPSTDRLALEANFYLGLARFNSANYAGAETAFAFVATQLPLSEVTNNQAVALSRQGKDAVALFQRASTADPSNQDYHYNLAIALFRRGDTVQALQEADAALKLKPNDNEAGALRARVSVVPLGTRLTDDASGGFSPVERINRNYSETSFRQAAFQLAQVRTMRMAMLPPTQQATEYTQLGEEYLSQGLLPEAEEQFAAALAADANSAPAHAGLARVRELSGNKTDARTEAQTSLRLHQNVEALLVLARLDLASNDLAASADSVGRALQLEPTNGAVLGMRQNLQQRGQAVP